MTQQLSLFVCDTTTLESKVLLVIEIDNEILDIQAEGKALNETIAAERKDVNARMKDAKERRARASKELYALKRAGV